MNILESFTAYSRTFQNFLQYSRIFRKIFSCGTDKYLMVDSLILHIMPWASLAAAFKWEYSRDIPEYSRMFQIIPEHSKISQSYFRIFRCFFQAVLCIPHGWELDITLMTWASLVAEKGSASSAAIISLIPRLSHRLSYSTIRTISWSWYSSTNYFMARALRVRSES